MKNFIVLFALVATALLWLVFPPDFSTPPVKVLLPDAQALVQVVPSVSTLPVTLPELVPVQVFEPVPAMSYRYRHAIEVAAIRAFGLDAPVALLAAQIRAESAYSATAYSTAGAQGMAQFMPNTARSMARLYPELRPANPRDPSWAFRAQALHMRDLVASYPSADTLCDRYAFALSAYNGGPKALDRERALATATTVWFGAGGVEPQRSRTRANWNENRTYVRRILIDWEPDYSAAGWRGGLGCSV